MPMLKILGITDVLAVLELDKADLALCQPVLLLGGQLPGIAVPAFFDEHFRHFTRRWISWPDRGALQLHFALDFVEMFVSILIFVNILGK